jgi:hypothetical protein
MRDVAIQGEPESQTQSNNNTPLQLSQFRQEAKFDFVD